MMGVENDDQWLSELITNVKVDMGDLSPEGSELPTLNLSVDNIETPFTLSIDTRTLVENIAISTKMLEHSFSGFKFILSSMHGDVAIDTEIKGKYGTYMVPYSIVEPNRQILFMPSILPSFFEVMGLRREDTFNLMAPFLSLDFLKFIDLMSSWETPTIMVYYGPTGMGNIEGVDMNTMMSTILSNNNLPTTPEDATNYMETKNLYGLDIQKMFESYGIAKIDFNMRAALHASIIGKEGFDSPVMKGYYDELGIDKLLNPSVLDYYQYAKINTGDVEPEELGLFMQTGKDLGHEPADAIILPDIRAEKVIDDPHDFLEHLEQKGLLVKVNAKYKQTNQGISLMDVDIEGKTAYITLDKIWKTMKKVKEYVLFLKFVKG